MDVTIPILGVEVVSEVDYTREPTFTGVFGAGAGAGVGAGAGAGAGVNSCNRRRTAVARRAEVDLVGVDGTTGEL